MVEMAGIAATEHEFAGFRQSIPGLRLANEHSLADPVTPPRSGNAGHRRARPMMDESLIELVPKATENRRLCKGLIP